MKPNLFLKDGLTYPPNTKIVASKGAYAYKNTTNIFKTQFKTKPTDKDSIIFSNNLGKISFYTLANQSFGKINSSNPPIADGSSIIYPEIFPKIDLRYTISSSRLLEEFIVKDAATAAQITRIEQRARTSDTYRQNNDGSITFSNKDKVVFTLPHPVMYETANQENKSEGIVYEIKEDNGELIITKVITDEGRSWLADPARVYPIAIDLVIDNADTSSDWVSSDPTNTTVSQETTIVQEGAGSVKVQTVAAGAPVTVDLMEYSSDGTAQAAYVSNNATSATGGTITTSGNFTIHTFTSSGTFTPNSSGDVEALVVGGGGGGGKHTGGGGGAGGMLTGSSAVTPQTYTVTVGGGGTGATANTPKGVNGANSVFSSLTAVGGGGGGSVNSSGSTGGSGGGGSRVAGGAGTGGQGYRGGNASGVIGAGGGGAGASGTDVAQPGTPNGGNGISSSISGVAVTYAGGGGGAGERSYSVSGAGGSGGGGAGGTPNSGNGGEGAANRGGGGGGGPVLANGGAGGSGIVIVRYLTTPALQSYTEGTIKTQGTYALKGVGQTTTSLNKTLTRTIGSPLNLSDHTSITFDLRASRTGSNIKVGLRDSGGTTTEVTPNITSANVFQTVTINLSDVTNANKDAIDRIIITIVNADAANTFYLDNMTATALYSLNDTVTRTTTATNLSAAAYITYWVRSSVAGSYATFGFGESAATEQTQTITINQANTWEQKSWDISGITGTSRDAVTEYAFTFTGNTSEAAFYFDDIQTNALFAPTAGAPTSLSSSAIRWNFTDNSTEETGFIVYDTSNVVKATCATANLTYCDETGLAVNTQYTRKIGTYNSSFSPIPTGTVAGFTLAAVPTTPTVNTRTTTSVNVAPSYGTNPATTELALYMVENSVTCNGTGGVYIADNGSSNGATAIWQASSVWGSANNGTVSVTGLSSEKAYVFCVKARNGSNIETTFSSVGSYNAGYIPLSGDFLCTSETASSSAITNRYVDGSNPARYIIALDSGAGATNNAVFEVKSCIMTLNSTDTLVVGSLELTGGSIAIATGGQIKIGSPAWIIDADGDGYSLDNKLYYGSQPIGGRRKNLATTLVAGSTDCNDTSASLYRSVAGYLDSDGDGYGAGAYTTCGGAGSYVANASDCNDTTNTIRTTNITGGTITTSGTNKIHTFTGSGTLTVSCPGSLSVQALVVAGGGGSGSNGGGGGGAGGVLYNASLAVTPQAYTVTVGGGGAGSSNNAQRGGNSVFSSMTTTGGGGGGSRDADTAGKAGGSGGGGGGASSNTTGGGRVVGQGSIGGAGFGGGGDAGPGGGGGCGAAGSNGTRTVGGNGGIGCAYSISGSSIYYGGGGGGGLVGGFSGTPGLGGNGGGNGVTPGGLGNNGVANRGGGAGGNNATGGSGVIIIRYANP